MGGLFCRGLHCAGCGKGVPALVVVGGLVALAAMGLIPLAHALLVALYWLAGAVVVGGVVVGVGLVKLHNSRLQGCVVWDDSPMMSDLVQPPSSFASIVSTGQNVPIWPTYPAYKNVGWRGGLPVQPHGDDGGGQSPDADLSPSSSPYSPEGS